MNSMNVNNSLGMYIHIPFCINKCNYCDFYSVPLTDKTYLDKYTEALIKEITIKSNAMPDVKLESIYLGGGTPSLLNVRQVKEILKAAHQFNVMPQAEISMEVNPASLNPDKLQGWQEAGVNRISVGVQSFFDDELALLGRMHNSSAVMETVEMLHNEEWENFNLDLIYGLPGQTPARWRQNLEKAVDCQPTHLSLYLLQLEEQTPMGKDVARGKLNMLDEDEEWYMYSLAMEYLESRGFNHYEISNFCLPGYECRHNLIYWQGREYLGIGAGAVTFTAYQRYMNKPDIKKYTATLLSGNQCPVNELEHMSKRELMVDALILGLRLCQGINLLDFQQRFQVDISSEYKKNIAHYMERGLLQMEDGNLKFTKEGYFLSNQVLSSFMS